MSLLVTQVHVDNSINVSISAFERVMRDLVCASEGTNNIRRKEKTHTHAQSVTWKYQDWLCVPQPFCNGLSCS